MCNRVKGRVFEVFESVQGEGLYLGEKQIFVRMFGCNLSCAFCDTPLNRFIEYQPHELFEEILLYNSREYHSISFTGGEPLLQKDFLKEVFKLTSANGYKNYLETNGTLAPELGELISYVDIVAMDLKLPSSSFMGNLWNFHRRFLKIARKKEVFVKAIICSWTEERDIREAISLISDVDPAITLVLQPNSSEEGTYLDSKLAAYMDICSAEKITACVIPQIHKVVGIK